MKAGPIAIFFLWVRQTEIERETKFPCYLDTILRVLRIPLA